MAIEILMPALSPTMQEGNLARWLKKEGEPVSPGDIIAEIETDKATMEVEAVDEGVLAKITVAEGTEGVKVNQLIGVLKEDGDNEEDVNNIISKKPASQSSNEQSGINASQISPSEAIQERSSDSERKFISPLARRIADNEGIDISKITGTGPHGRIIKADIKEYKPSPKHNSPAPSSNMLGRNPKEYSLQNISSMRKVIAKRLVESKQTIPHFYLSLDCNIDKLINARKQINERAPESEGKKAYKLSINDFVIKATAQALRIVPQMNAAWSDSGIMLFNNVDIAIAVALDDGLITPIVKNANLKSLSEISNEMKALAKRARDNSLAPEEYQGGGFSISNLGMYGIKQFNAIVNPPQAGILAVGSVETKPILGSDNSWVAANFMNITLSCDHRIADGAVAARFLQAVQKYLEDPVTMLV